MFKLGSTDANGNATRYGHITSTENGDRDAWVRGGSYRKREFDTGKTTRLSSGVAVVVRVPIFRSIEEG